MQTFDCIVSTYININARSTTICSSQIDDKTNTEVKWHRQGGPHLDILLKFGNKEGLLKAYQRQLVQVHGKIDNE